MPPSTGNLSQRAEDANTKLRVLSHQIRVTEAHLAQAERRRRRSNVALALGPVLLIVLFELYFFLRGHTRLIQAIYIPCGLLAVFAAIASLKYKLTPGGPPKGKIDWDTPRPRPRQSESELELEVARLRDERKVVAGDAGMDIKVRRIAYRNEAYEDIDNFRDDSARYRRVNNILQGVLIVGSLAATGTAAITGEVPNVRWATLGITFLVGIASGFMGYFKYKERSFYLQQTADAIETEWEAVEVGVGKYENKEEPQRLAIFVEEVHRLKAEQKKREQNLEQPPESRNAKD